MAMVVAIGFPEQRQRVPLHGTDVSIEPSLLTHRHGHDPKTVLEPNHFR
jgi:hypothetical protein